MKTNPLAAMGALATVQTILNDQLVANSARIGATNSIPFAKKSSKKHLDESFGKWKSLAEGSDGGPDEN